METHPHQLEIATDETRFKVAVTGRRWGKSVLGREVALKYAKKFKNSLIWIIAPTREMGRDIHWESLKKRIAELDWKVKYNETRLSVTRILNGSQIVIKSADNPDSLRGRGLRLAIIDEFRDMEQRIWTEILRPALSDTEGHALFISTPNGFDVLYDLYTKGQGQDSEYKSWHYKTIDSPFISADEIDKAKTEMDERTFRQEYEASFETAEGRVYYNFDRKKHAKELQPNRHLPLRLSFDFNFSESPMTTSISQIDGNVLNILHTENNKSDLYYHCKQVAEAIKNIEYNGELYLYGDATKVKSIESNLTNWEIVKRYFANAISKVPSSNPAVLDRVNSVCSRLQNTKKEIFIYVNNKGCDELIKDFESVVWQKNKRDIDKTDALRTHNSDNIGYLVWQEFPLRNKPETTWGKAV